MNPELNDVSQRVPDENSCLWFDHTYIYIYICSNFGFQPQTLALWPVRSPRPAARGSAPRGMAPHAPRRGTGWLWGDMTFMLRVVGLFCDTRESPFL